MLSNYITSINYQRATSYAGGTKVDGEMSEEKKSEIRTIYNGFSEELSNKVVGLRGQSIKECDLTRFYTSKQALECGLIDNVDRVFNAIPRMIPNATLTVLKQSKLEEIKATLRQVATSRSSFDY